MNWNSLVTSYRFILKSKLFTAINLIGLTAGLTISFFLLIYIINELSYNSFPAESSRIYRIITHTTETNTPFSPSLLPLRISEQTKGILSSGSLICVQFTLGPVVVSNGHQSAEEPGFFCADTTLLDMLSFRMISGDGKSSLTEGRCVIISQRAAQKYFGQLDPVGQQMEVKCGGIAIPLTVAGVFRNLPWNSTLKIDFIAGMDFFENLMEQFGVDLSQETGSYSDYYSENYILVDPGLRLQELVDQMPALLDRLGITDQQVTYTFQNIRDIHLDSGEITNDFHQKGNRASLFYYGTLAIAVLLLAGINYSILSTARSALRYKEIGVRKVLGATKRELKAQILTESMLLTFLALPLSFLVLGFVEPFIDTLYGYEIQLYTWNMLIYIPLFAGITLLIGFVSGAYLAFYLSALTPLRALKNQVIKRKRFNFSKLFIVFQLSITLLLLGCTMVIFAQLDYCLNTNLGIQKTNLLIVGFNPEEFTEYRELRDRVRREPGVVALSGSSIIPPTNASASISVEAASADSVPVTYYLESYFVDSAFFSTLGIDMVEGEDMMPPHPGQSRIPVILNQEAIALLGRQHPIGTTLGRSLITGVVKDFNIHSFHSEITPAVFAYDPSQCKYLVVRSRSGEAEEVRQRVEKHWRDLAPGIPFKGSTFDEELSIMYDAERKFGQVVASLSFMAFLITGMGLFGMALLMIERRLKEIAVRKIFGASDKDILIRMQKEFLLYVLLASVFAIPATWYTMTVWLSSFYYKVPLHWYLFVLAVLFITLFVSSIIMIRTWMVLRKNLINVLRYE